MKNKIDIQALIVSLLFVTLFFREILVNVVGGVDYIDEALTLMFLLIITYKIIKGESYNNLKTYKKLFIPLFIIIFLGILSGILSKLNLNVVSIFIDIIAIIKLPTFFFFCTIILNKKVVSKAINIIRPFLILYISIIFVFSILHLVGFFQSMSYDQRFGIQSFKFIYNNPGTVNEKMICALSIISVYNKSRFKSLFQTLVVIVIITTLRTNGLVALALWPIILLISKNKTQFNFKVVLIPIFAIILGYNQIRNYFSTSSITPRGILFRDGFKIMFEHFPLGTGFSTFGSDQAFKVYSPLYYQLGYENIWGLSSYTGFFLHDTFWPMIAAQFGIIGLIMYIIFTINLLLYFFKMKVPMNIKGVAITIIIYLFISSIGASVLTGAEGATIVMAVSFCINNLSNNIHEIQTN